jgi:uncharacterized protein YndB with AHSA1/START domain
MARIQRCISIAASPERVFAALVNWAGLTRWSTITDKHHGADQCVGVGDVFDQTVRIAGLRLDTHWRVTEYDPPRAVAYHVTADAGGRMTIRQTVHAGDSGSRVEFDIDYDLPAGFLGELLDKVYVERRNQREAEHSLANLKDLLEGAG